MLSLSATISLELSQLAGREAHFMAETAWAGDIRKRGVGKFHRVQYALSTTYFTAT
jgi:hypothetical protein